MNVLEQPYLPGMENVILKSAPKMIVDIYKQLHDNNLYFSKFIPLIDLIETYQGEGPNCGKKMVLARFKYCNKHCPFCDTWKMMNDLKPTMRSLKDIEMLLRSSPNLMITGGEPTLETKNNANELSMSQMDCTITMAATLNYKFLDIETNGYKLKELSECVDFIRRNTNKNINISWSPKFIQKNDFEDNIQKVVNNSSENVTMKVVIGDDMDDYKRFVYKCVLDYGWDSNKLYLMPKGTTLDEINNSMEQVLEVASDLSCNVSSRLHIIHNFK